MGIQLSLCTCIKHQVQTPNYVIPYLRELPQYIQRIQRQSLKTCHDIFPHFKETMTFFSETFEIKITVSPLRTRYVVFNKIRVS